MGKLVTILVGTVVLAAATYLDPLYPLIGSLSLGIWCVMFAVVMGHE